MGVSIACFIISFLLLQEEPFIRYGDPLSLVLCLALPKDVHAWQKRLYAGYQDSFGGRVLSPLPRHS
jgi:hypothetical protein